MATRLLVCVNSDEAPLCHVGQEYQTGSDQGADELLVAVDGAQHLYPAHCFVDKSAWVDQNAK